MATTAVECLSFEDALKELKEDSLTRVRALEQMREWIRRNQAIKSCRTDDAFLLRFLRTKKFNIPQAFSRLENFLSVRELYPKWFQNLDIEDPVISAIIDDGYLLPLPQRDKHNRQVILTRPGYFDPYKYTSEYMIKTHCVVLESLLDDELNQIYGYTIILDEEGIVMGHVSIFSLSEIRTLLQCIQKTIPVRSKQIHLVNLPSFANKIIEFGTSLLNDKLKKRVLIHKSVDELSSHYDPSILPKEYGGEIPISDMIAAFKQKLRDKRNEVLALNDMRIVVDPNYSLGGKDSEQRTMETVGSFRKLEVD